MSKSLRDFSRPLIRHTRRLLSAAVWEYLMKPGRRRSGRSPYGAEELRLVREALVSQNLCAVDGQMVRAFERAFAAAHDLPYAVASTSGTAAIHVALGALDLSPGDEVITTPITDLGTIIPIIQMNAVPVFADVDGRYNLDPADVARKISPRTRAIVAVHLFGNPCDMEAMRAVADAHRVPLIEDCAQAHFATYRGRRVGTLGDIGCFSFQQSKLMTTGDGGMTVTANHAYYERMKLFVDKGWARKGFGPRAYLFHAPNYRMTELTGAVGLAQLGKVARVVARRRDVGDYLGERLATIGGVLPAPLTPGATHVYWIYPVIVDAGIDVSALALDLRRHKVWASGGYIGKPIYLCSESLSAKKTFGTSQWPFTRHEPEITYEYKEGLCPRAEEQLSRLLILPLDESWTRERADHAVDALGRCLAAGTGERVAVPATADAAARRTDVSRTHAAARVAIVGCGQMGRWHLEAYARNPRVEVVAFADTDVERARRLAGDTGARAYGSHRDLLKHERLDGISVCVVPAAHRAVVLDALEAGVHVLCEKPLATSLEEAVEMTARARQRQRFLLTAFKFRFFDEVGQARTLIESGAIGRLISARLMFGGDMDVANTWYAEPAVSGGGVLMDNGPHAFDIIEHLLGRIDSVNAAGEVTPTMSVEGSAHVAGRMRAGGNVTIDLSWSMPAPSKTYLEIYGTQGTILMGLDGIAWKLATWADWKRLANGASVKEAFARQIDHFVDVLHGRAPSVVDDDAGVRAQRLVAAAYASMRDGGSPVSIDEATDVSVHDELPAAAARAS